MSEPNFSILTLGSINMDLVLNMERIPTAGESIYGKKYSYIAGGKGGNQAVAASKIGAKITFLGKVGNDINGTVLKEGLEKKGISTEFMYIDQHTPTGLAVIVLETSGQNRIIVYPGANMMLTLDEIVRAFKRNYHALLMQFEIPQDIAIAAFKLAKEKNIPVIVDAGPAQNFPLEEIYGIEILSPNETETYAMCGINPDNFDKALEAATILKKRSGAKFVILKMGEKGALLHSDNMTEMFSGLTVKAVDTTAAGDAFTAALTLEYLKSGNIEKAVRYANIVGAITVTKFGAQTSLPTREEIHAFIKQRKIKL